MEVVSSNEIANELRGSTLQKELAKLK